MKWHYLAAFVKHSPTFTAIQWPYEEGVKLWEEKSTEERKC